MEEKIQLKHPAGKNNKRIDVDKFEPIKALLINTLRKHGELNHTELFKYGRADLQKSKIPFDGSVDWYMESVKLHLEAEHVIERTNDKPQKYRLANE